MPAAVTAAFAANPAATLALTDMGHAYGKARYSSTCPLTGTEIRAHEAIRKVTAWAPNGWTWTGYVSNRVIGLLNFHGVDGVDGITTWARCGDDWVAEALAKVATDERLTILRSNGTTTIYQRRADGSFRGEGYGNPSAAQLAATLRRGSQNRAYHVGA